jgi:hypothetical protein
MALLLIARVSHGEAMRIDFDAMETGGVPAGFTNALTGEGGPSQWIVRNETDAPSGKQVVIQLSTDRAKYRFPVCIYDGFNSADVTVSVKFKAISGSADQAAGIVWRYQNADNYYVARANALENNVVLYKMENGKRSDLKPTDAGWLAYGKDVPVPTGKWNELRVVAAGTRFAVSLNGTHLFDVEDGTFRAPGQVGLWTKADSVTAFDDFTIEVPNVRQ